MSGSLESNVQLPLTGPGELTSDAVHLLSGGTDAAGRGFGMKATAGGVGRADPWARARRVVLGNGDTHVLQESSSRVLPTAARQRRLARLAATR